MPQFALDRLPRLKSGTLYAAYTKFEKQHGTRSVLESTVLGKRRIQYEEEVAHDGRNYDVWFDFIRLEEGALRTLRDEGGAKEEENAAIERVREVYERAVSHVPPGQEKRHWRRYIFLWLDYALFEEIDTKVQSSKHMCVTSHRSFLGLRTRTAGLSNSTQSCSTQAIHICQAVDHGCAL